MVSRDTEKEFDERDALQHYVDDVKANESPSLDSPLSSVRPEATKGYIGKWSFAIWTLVAIVGIALCLVHSHQDSFWQWTGDTAADAQSLKAKVVVSIFSASIGICVAAVLSKALVSVSYVIMRYRGANFSHLANVIEGYLASRFFTLFMGRRWKSCMLIMFLLAVSVTTKQMAVVSMGVELMVTNNTKVSYTRNYTNCATIRTASGANSIQTIAIVQMLNGILIPNSSYTSEYYDSSIPLGLAGYSQFERVLPYAEASCEQFKSSASFGTMVPPITSLGVWQLKITLPFTNAASDGRWVNCTLKAGFANAISTCNDTKCETIRTSKGIRPFSKTVIGLPSGIGLHSFLQWLFNGYKPSTSMINNIIITWLLGGDVLRNIYSYNSDLPSVPTAKSIADRLALLGTVTARVMCDVNAAVEDPDGEFRKIIPDSPITSNYIEHSYYQYKILWRWPFYILVGCILILWMLCMIAMWLAPESRVLSTDWLLNQYISRHQNGYLSGQDLVRVHGVSKFQVFDNNANGNVGNIVISTAESHKFDKYDRVIQDKQYQ